MKIGLLGLLQSRKGTLSLIIVALSSAANMLNHLDGTAFAAVIATVSGIFCWTAHKVDLASLKSGGAKDE